MYMHLAEKGECICCFIKIGEHVHFIDTKEWDSFLTYVSIPLLLISNSLISDSLPGCQAYRKAPVVSIDILGVYSYEAEWFVFVSRLTLKKVNLNLNLNLQPGR